MPAVGTHEEIPNMPLNGYELAIYSRSVLSKVLADHTWPQSHRESVESAMQKALENDWIFGGSFTYPNVSFEITLLSHAIEETTAERFAFTLELLFRFPNNPNNPQSKPFVRRPVGISEPPLEGYGPNALHVVDCFKLAIAVENPNLIRVHCGLPIIVTEKIQPKHGEMFGSLRHHEVKYDPKDYEPLPEPKFTSLSAEYSEIWQIREAEAIIEPVVPEETTNLPQAIEQLGAASSLEFPKPPRRERGRK